MAQKEGVQVHSHDVIYRFLDDVKSVMSGLLPSAFKETVIGEAKTLEVSQCILYCIVLYSVHTVLYCIVPKVLRRR